MKTWFTIIQSRHLTVRAHYTWLLLLALGLWSLVRVALPARVSAGEPIWSTALIIMLVYIACVALHEAAHLVTARLLGVPMRTLNIHPIGALARLGRERSGPVRTFAVAAAGPLANLILWLVLRTVDPLVGTAEAAIVSFAASFTLTLGLINLLPGLPLDGGRMLRAVVWFGTDFDLGTRVATGTGYIVAGGTLVVGLRALTDPATSLRGAWIVLLAWLIYAAGAALLRRRTVHTLLHRLTARDVLQPPTWTAAPDTTLRELVTSWNGLAGENATPVLQDGAVLGLITRSAVADVPQGYWNERTVGATMQPISALTTFTPETPLAEVLTHIDPDDFNPQSLLVTDAGRFVGVIEPRELTVLLDVQDVLGMGTPAAPTRPLDPAAAPTTAERLLRKDIRHGA